MRGISRNGEDTRWVEARCSAVTPATTAAADDDFEYAAVLPGSQLAHFLTQRVPVRKGDHELFTAMLQASNVRLKQADIAVQNARRRKATITELYRPVAGRQRVLLKAID